MARIILSKSGQHNMRVLKKSQGQIDSNFCSFFKFKIVISHDKFETYKNLIQLLNRKYNSFFCEFINFKFQKGIKTSIK